MATMAPLVKNMALTAARACRSTLETVGAEDMGPMLSTPSSGPVPGPRREQMDRVAAGLGSEFRG